MLFLSVLSLAFVLPRAMAQTSSTEPGSSAGPGGTINDDAAMKQDSSAIRKQIRQNLDKQQLTDVKVDVTRTEIQLSGKVPTRADRINALEIARSLGQEHHKIIDNMTVTGDNDSNPPAGNSSTPPPDQGYPR